jgi:crossover junction endodeoxyribonuclease RuvC
MLILGVDPGINGGFFLVENGKPSDMAIMPVTRECAGFAKSAGRLKRDKEGNKILKYKTEVDVKMVCQLLSRWSPNHIFLEKVHAFPGQGVTSMFSFGCSYGILRGVMGWLDCKVTLIEPKDWQGVILGERGKDDDTKEISARVAADLWPTVNFLKSARSKKPHDGLCDAACMAAYGVRVLSEGIVASTEGNQKVISEKDSVPIGS